MWAMIPMFRTRSSATCVAVVVLIPLPPVVREGLVRLRHPVHVVLALERAALLVDRVEQLRRELVLHPLLAALPGIRDEVAEREGAAAARRHLDRNLVVRAADPARADLEHRRDGLDGSLEGLERRLPRFLGDLRERVVDDALGDRLLAVEH